MEEDNDKGTLEEKGQDLDLLIDLTKRIIKNTKDGYEDRVTDCLQDEEISRRGVDRTFEEIAWSFNNCLKQFDKVKKVI